MTGIVAHDREAESGGMSPRGVNIYDNGRVDGFQWVPNGGNSVVAHDRETEGGGVYPGDMIIHATLGVDNVH